MKPRWQIELVTDAPSSVRNCVAGIANSSLGRLLVVTCSGKIRMIHFIDDRKRAEHALLNRWPDARVSWNHQRATDIARRITTASPANPQPFTIAVSGTHFQIDVWRALLEIPFGQTTSYRQLARMAGHTAAIRAVGTAVGSNPVAVLVPCHRVIRSDGSTGRYRWGAAVKQSLLDWEAGGG